MYQLKHKLWLEYQDEKIFGKGPLQLLEGVKRTGSLSEAAKAMNMSYNKAHNLIKHIEAVLEVDLIRAKKGGSKGGGSELTVGAEELIARYSSFEKEAEAALAEIYRKHFD